MPPRFDTREQTPLSFGRLQSVPGTLITVDYSIAGLEHLLSVERKTVMDLVSCCTAENRARFEHALHRLQGYRFSRLLVIGTENEIRQHRYFSRISRRSCSKLRLPFYIECAKYNMLPLAQHIQ